ncbi:uncharacterized protein LOC143774712 [Ranitomeya variabilis]|uniref:uncharacterized protein LOC143774712 n=1 Tax=Ranitomeya variabilis TaxID=490064 RepID=UPI004057990E
MSLCRPSPETSINDEASHWDSQMKDHQKGNRVNFIERHQADLITKIQYVDPVVRDLHDQNLLTAHQFLEVIMMKTFKERNTKLFDIVSHWEDTGKFMVYRLLRKHSEKLIKYLEMKDWIRTNAHLPFIKIRINFINRHRTDLVRWTKDIDSVLRDLFDPNLLDVGQNHNVKAKTTSEEKMEELCDIISHWDDAGKYVAYTVLVKYNEKIKSFEVKDWIDFTGILNFIDLHQSDLIRWIRHVDPVLHDLYDQHLLTEEQYNGVKAKTTSKDKMKELCDIISHWEDTEKYKAYVILREHNEDIIKNLEMKDRTSSEDHTLYFKGILNFIDLHQSDLIRLIRPVDPVLHDLYDQHLLTEEQYNGVKAKTTSKDKMKELCDIISHWEDTEKYKAYVILREHNEDIIQYLEMNDWTSSEDHTLYFTGILNFIDLHQSDLIRWIRFVDPVLHDLYDQYLLTEQQYNSVKEKTTSKGKLKELCDIISHWEDTEKYKAYVIFREHNEDIIQYLEMKDRTSSEDHTLYLKDKANFIDHHRSVLIQRITDINPILCNFRNQELLTQEQYNDVKEKTTPREKMRQLCDIISHWEDTGKFLAYIVLKKYNEEIIQDLEKLDWSGSTVDHSVLFIELSHVMENPQQCTVEMPVDNISCKLCGKEKDQEEELAEVVTTVGGVYRLELNSPGLYHCRKTGIKFLVKGPVIIEYKPESWVDHLKQIPESTFEILGSLFNIKTSGDPNAVSAVHLPHFLCLKGSHEDRGLIKCAHFQDGNLTLMNPTQIDPFYVVLENPIFSCLGPLLSIGKKKIPIHGIVLIYFKIMCKGDPAEEYRIHLYVLPHIINAEENLDKENKKFGFQRIKKPEQTIDAVYTKVKYLVTGRPVELICPETVKFQAERYNYTEIQLKKKDVNICLYVSETNTGDQVWRVHLSKSDINDITQSLSQLTMYEVPGACSTHFMEKHMAALIQRTASIRPVMDNLLSQNVLTQEQYDTVRSRTPDQEAMRQLYEYMRSWSYIEKDKFYEAVKKHNRHLITDLEARDDTDRDYQ